MSLLDPYLKPAMGFVDMLGYILGGGGVSGRVQTAPVTTTPAMFAQAAAGVQPAAPSGTVIVTGLTHEQQLAAQAAHQALEGHSGGTGLWTGTGPAAETTVSGTLQGSTSGQVPTNVLGTVIIASAPPPVPVTPGPDTPATPPDAGAQQPVDPGGTQRQQRGQSFKI